MKSEVRSHCLGSASEGKPLQLACGHHICHKHLNNIDKCPVCLRNAVVEKAPEKCHPKCGGCAAKRGTVVCVACSCIHCIECDAFFHSKLFSERHSRFLAENSTDNVSVHMTCDCHSKPLSLFCSLCEMRVCEDCVNADNFKFRTTGRKGGGLDGGEHCGHPYIHLETAITQVYRPKLKASQTPLTEQMRIADLLLRKIRVRVSHLQHEEQEATRRLSSTPIVETADEEGDKDAKRPSSVKNDGTIQVPSTEKGGRDQDVLTASSVKGNEHQDAEADDGLSAVGKIDKEFRHITRLLHERQLLLVRSVQQAARDKMVKLHQQAHMLHELHAILFVLKHDHTLQIEAGETLLPRQDSHDEVYCNEVACLLEWTSHSFLKSDKILLMDVLDEIGHLAAPAIPLHFPTQTASRLLTFGTVDGPAPPEHLRCCMARHDTYAQAITLSWTSAKALAKKRRREAAMRMRKHHSRNAVFDPYEKHSGGDDFEFGSSSDDDSEKGRDESGTTSPVESPQQRSLLDLSHHDHARDNIINMVCAEEMITLADLETIESEVAKAAARPVQVADHHVVEMLVLPEEDKGEAFMNPLLYEPGRGAFVSIGVVSQEHSHLDINISQHPNSTLQFRVRGSTKEGILGEPSVVLTFFTPRIFGHTCTYNEEKGPFASTTGLFNQLGTDFGSHEYHNPFSAGAVSVCASKVESGRLHSFVSEGHDGDLVVCPHEVPILSLPFFHHHDRAHGHAWIEVDISHGAAKDREFMLIPNYYCLRSASGEGGKPRSWVLEGCRERPPSGATPSGGSSGSSSGGDGSSVDVGGWEVLSEHKHDASLALTHCSTAAWPILADDKQVPSRAFRYFRIVNTGSNSCGNKNLECSGFELYGRVVLVGRELEDDA